MTEPQVPTPPPPGQRVNRYGRTGALTEELQQKIVTVVKAGNYLKVAAQFNGIGESTLRSWLQRGRAAAAAIEAHPEGHRYCPDCGHDRTDAWQRTERVNAEEDARRQWRLANLPEGEENVEPRPYAALGACPECSSHAYPEEWELPQEEARYLSFLEAITQAETAAEVAAVTHWRAAFADDWRAARDYLVRSKPDRWAATTRVQVSQEEADRRIDAAAEQVLIAVGVDTEQSADLDDVTAGILDSLDGGGEGDA